jgi:hypothetical protein
MDTKKGKGPDEREQDLKAKQDQPERNLILLDTGLQDKEEGESHEDEGDHPDW